MALVILHFTLVSSVICSFLTQNTCVILLNDDFKLLDSPPAWPAAYPVCGMCCSGGGGGTLSWSWPGGGWAPSPGPGWGEEGGTLSWSWLGEGGGILSCSGWGRVGEGGTGVPCPGPDRRGGEHPVLVLAGGEEGGTLSCSGWGRVGEGGTGVPCPGPWQGGGAGQGVSQDLNGVPPSPPVNKLKTLPFPRTTYASGKNEMEQKCKAVNCLRI